MLPTEISKSEGDIRDWVHFGGCTTALKLECSTADIVPKGLESPIKQNPVPESQIPEYHVLDHGLIQSGALETGSHHRLCQLHWN